MLKTCDSCLPNHRGYTISFDNQQSYAILQMYCNNYLEKHVNAGNIDVAAPYPPKNAPFKYQQQRCPHIVKLAKEYVDGICTDSTKQSREKSLLRVAEQIKAQMLAEGAEIREDMNYLHWIGYELFQGYYFLKPQEVPIKTIRGDMSG